MKEQIYTIPINEAFEQEDGCPVCRLYEKLEENSLDYIMGAAMMEPDVRIKTNEQGFCSAHFAKMLTMKNRLSLALMLESRLQEIEKQLFEKTGKAFSGAPDPKKFSAAAETMAGSCFVCRRIDSFMDNYYKNIVYLWKTEQDFRDKFAAQPYFCIHHMSALLNYAKKGLGSKEQAAFTQEMARIERAYVQALHDDVSKFCKSFDYRYAGEELGSAKDSVERAALFLGK